MKHLYSPLVLLIIPFAALSQTPYRLPPAEIVKMVDAPPTPII